MNECRSPVNQAPAICRQTRTEFIPDTLNNVWMAALAHVGVYNTVWCSEDCVQRFLTATEILENASIRQAGGIYDHFPLAREQRLA